MNHIIDLRPFYDEMAKIGSGYKFYWYFPVSSMARAMLLSPPCYRDKVDWILESMEAELDQFNRKNQQEGLPYVDYSEDDQEIADATAMMSYEFVDLLIDTFAKTVEDPLRMKLNEETCSFVCFLHGGSVVIST